MGYGLGQAMAAPKPLLTIWVSWDLKLEARAALLLMAFKRWASYQAVLLGGDARRGRDWETV